MLKQANQLVQQDRYAQAIVLYDQFIASNPEQNSLFAALYNKAQAQDQSSLYSQAASTYQKIIDIDPKFKQGQPYYEQGQLYQTARMLVECSNSYKKYLEVNPAHAQCNFNLGNALEQLGQLEQAIRCFEKAYQSKPNYVKAYKAKINLLKKQNRYQQIAKTCSLGLKYQPTDFQLIYEEGLAFYKVKRFKEAQQAFKEAINSNRKFVRGYISLGETYYKLEKDEQGLSILQKCLVQNKDVMKTKQLKQIRLCMGVIKMNLKKYKQAIQCFQFVLSQPPPIPHVKLKMAVCLEEEGNISFKGKNYSDALLCYNQSLKNDPNRISVINNAGLSYQNINNHLQAQKCFKKVLQLQPNHISALNNLATLYHQHGNQQEAQKIFEKLQHSYPENYETLINNGKRFMTLKKYKEAIEQFKKAESVQKAKNNFYLFNDMTVAFEELGNFQDALRYADTANKLSDYRSPLFLINRASVLMHLKRISQAKRDIERAAQEIRNPDRSYLIKLGVNAQNLKFIFNQLNHYAYLMSPIDIFREGLKKEVQNGESLKNQEVVNQIAKIVDRAEIYALSQVMTEIKKEKQHQQTQIDPEKARLDLTTVKKFIDDAKSLMQKQLDEQRKELKTMKMQLSMVKRESKQMKQKLKYLPQSCNLRQTLQQLYNKKDIQIWQYGKQLYWILNGYLTGYMLVHAGVVGKGDNIDRSIFSKAISKVGGILQFASNIPVIGDFSELISKVCGLFVDLQDEVIIKKMFQLISFNYDTQEQLNDAICNSVKLFITHPGKIKKIREKLIFDPPTGYLERLQETLDSVGKWFEQKKDEFVAHIRGFQKSQNILQSELAVIDVGLIISIMLSTTSNCQQKLPVVTNAAKKALEECKLQEMVCQAYTRENENLRVSNNSFCLVMHCLVEYDNPMLNDQFFMQFAKKRGRQIMTKIINFNNTHLLPTIEKLLKKYKFEEILMLIK